MEMGHINVFAARCENDAEPFDPCYHELDGPIERDVTWLETELKNQYATDRVQIWCLEFSRDIMVALGSELPELQQDLILQGVDHVFGPNGTYFWLQREDDGDSSVSLLPSDPSADVPMSPAPIAV